MTNKVTAKKRAPGGGRKPRGPFKGKTATLTTRITPEIRAALDSAAEKSRLSLSQEVERRLDFSLLRERNRAPDVLALAEAIAQFTEKVQEATGKQWREDAFTGEALRHGIDFLIRHFAARGAPVIPPRVQEAAARMLHIANERDRSPAGVGETEAGRVITLIEFFHGWPKAQLQHVIWSDELYRYLQLLRDLGSGWERAEAYVQKERRR
jgi:predicted transcriptional regulator